MSKDHQGGGKKKKKRSKSRFAFAFMSVGHVDKDGATPGEVYTDEQVMTNGDFYTGHWLNGLPHGHGKYLWTDGCMYIGEWSAGRMIGPGMFSWPSGATYEGDFKCGYMDGKGTYTGPAGDSYKGSWVNNLKHGQGTESYPNGDFYDGEWQDGIQEGQGRYQWKNGNIYMGNWSNGTISGGGTLLWENGNRHDGQWEDGVPKGNGTFRWADGSFYVGVWSSDAEEMSGTYYPSGGSDNLEWDPQDLFKVDLKDCDVSPGEKVTLFPSQKVVLIPGLERMSADGRASSYSLDSDDVDITTRNGFGEEEAKPHHIRIKPTSKQGITISKGHKNYDLMLNLQLGIRHSVGRPAPATSLDLKSSAFDPREKVWTKFPPEGSKHTPPHPSCDFRWKDYCPVVFRTLRKLFKVDAADYMISICGDDALRELVSPGKSGMFFYLTNDDKYMIKTMKKAEVKVFIRMLPAYYNHVRAFENTLVTKFFGLHCVRLTGPAQKKVRFVIMGNLFCSEYSIHRCFDLKGSSHGRTTDKPESEVDATTTLKDLDLSYLFRFNKFWYQEFVRQVDRDCDFLEQERIMDYSLLIGVHFRQSTSYRESSTPSRTSAVRTPPSGFQTPTGNGELDNDATPPRFSRIDMDKHLFDASRWAPIRLGISMPARVERTVRRNDSEAELIGEPTGDMFDVVLFFGIIDILQDYDISKKLEHAYKSFQFDPTSISAVDPKQYSKRFRDFIFKVFVEDT